MAERRPDFVKNIAELDGVESRYPQRDELFGMRRALSRPLGLTRLGAHHDTLEPGQRTSLPHAESTEEEGVYVITGTPTLWVDGELYPLRAGDFVAFQPGTGIAHTILNNGPGPATLLTIGERRSDNQVTYPRDADRMAELRPGIRWDDAPKGPQGSASPHPSRSTSSRADEVAIRHALEADIAPLFAMLNGSTVLDTIIWDGPQGLSDFEASIRRLSAATREGTAHFFVITCDGAPAGCIDVRPQNENNDCGDIGLWVGEPFQGRGAGTAAVGKIVEYARDTLDMRRIEARIFVGNWASRRIFEKNGFEHEGTLREAVIKRGEPIDEWMMANLRKSEAKRS